MCGLIKPLWYEPVRHCYRLLTDSGYRTFSLLEAQLRNLPRFTPRRIKIENLKLHLPDAASFLSAYREIFIEKIYAFKSREVAPRILDLGANIGLSVLFFKQLYPRSEITAFEADPKIFAYLEKNVHGNGYTDVQLINKAAWHENATLEFCSEGADGGRAAMMGDGNLIPVEAIDIGEFLRNNRFDFLKMDIEGAEEFVLPACKDSLTGIRFIFVEYHSKDGQKQCLDRLITILVEAGFRIHVHSVSASPSPFIEITTNTGFDLQLNIFGWRE
jgi:FkbM family methyltransferase